MQRGPLGLPMTASARSVPAMPARTPESRKQFPESRGHPDARRNRQTGGNTDLRYEAGARVANCSSPPRRYARPPWVVYEGGPTRGCVTSAAARLAWRTLGAPTTTAQMPNQNGDALGWLELPGPSTQVAAAPGLKGWGVAQPVSRLASKLAGLGVRQKPR